MHGKEKYIKSDLNRVDRIRDEDIDYSDIPALSQEFLSMPLANLPLKKSITIRFDSDVIDFFKAAGRGYQTKMNAILKAYVLAQAK